MHVLGVQDACDAKPLADTMRTCDDGGDAESGIVWRRKIMPKELENSEESSGVFRNAPAVVATASPTSWKEPTWSELPDLDLSSPEYCILFVGANNSGTAELSLEKEFNKAQHLKITRACI